jgi:hypothetical protein
LLTWEIKWSSEHESITAFAFLCSRIDNKFVYLIPLVPQMNTIANAVTATLEDLHKSTSKSAVEHRQRTGGWFGKINEWLRWLAVSILKHGKYFWL